MLLTYCLIVSTIPHKKEPHVASHSAGGASHKRGPETTGWDTNYREKEKGGRERINTGYEGMSGAVSSSSSDMGTNRQKCQQVQGLSDLAEECFFHPMPEYCVLSHVMGKGRAAPLAPGQLCQVLNANQPLSLSFSILTHWGGRRQIQLPGSAGNNMSPSSSDLRTN